MSDETDIKLLHRQVIHSLCNFYEAIRLADKKDYTYAFDLMDSIRKVHNHWLDEQVKEKT